MEDVGASTEIFLGTSFARREIFRVKSFSPAKISGRASRNDHAMDTIALNGSTKAFAVANRRWAEMMDHKHHGFSYLPLPWSLGITTYLSITN
jgi:hypothetical protein